MRGSRLQRVARRQACGPSKVGDAGNGYLASSCTASRWCLGSHPGAGVRRVAADIAAQAQSLEVGDLADSRDNKSAAEVGEKHLFRVARRPRARGKVGLAGGAGPTRRDEAGFVRLAKRVLGLRVVPMSC